jgi:hypothetical protein
MPPPSSEEKPKCKNIIIIILGILGILGILCIIAAFVISYYKIHILESEIDKLDYDKIYKDKTLYEYINQNKVDILNINTNLKKTDLNIDKLDTVIKSYINTSLQNSNKTISAETPSSLTEINNNLNSYITLNDEKLDKYILETNAKIDELTETNHTLMDSINNINSKLT